MSLNIGSKVHYIPFEGAEKELHQNGIIKSHSGEPNTVFVVFNCGDDWKNYQDYTGQNTSTLKLNAGWVEK